MQNYTNINHSEHDICLLCQFFFLFFVNRLSVDIYFPCRNNNFGDTGENLSLMARNLTDKIITKIYLRFIKNPDINSSLSTNFELKTLKK